ncbi:Uncharacterised protein [Serratia liquefaciens]|uniref:hypothetical protein n=1 Tax=Serratia liquefaciens TaxID=614 RepID=UPI0021794AAE|nr:hypothetical protein [Serratia liquefaciens]CAI0906908.1 Uncharacterised protein [Serratia liquefaciens]CAI1767258.1 Uncharacterised protein [Serratia liquefaciens]
MGRIAFPFLTLPDDVVKFDGWQIGVTGGPLSPATDFLQDWDYEVDLDIKFNISIDFIVAADFLGLDPIELRLAVVCTSGTGAGSIPRRVDTLGTFIFDKYNQSFDFFGRLSGSNLSAQLQLSLGIVLESPINSGGILSPKEVGSRLWQVHHNILLEDGGDSRFPIELASFSERYPSRLELNSLWLADWTPGTLHADFSGNVRLYVNSDYKVFSDRFVQGDTTTLQILVSDIMDQMIITMLDSDDVLETIYI